MISALQKRHETRMAQFGAPVRRTSSGYRSRWTLLLSPADICAQFPCGLDIQTLEKSAVVNLYRTKFRHASRGDRTHDHAIKSRALYLLS